jgi:hypothetical protein
MLGESVQGEVMLPWFTSAKISAIVKRLLNS